MSTQQYIVIHTPTGDAITADPVTLREAVGAHKRQKRVTAILSVDDARLANSPIRGYYVPQSGAIPAVQPGEMPDSEFSEE